MALRPKATTTSGPDDVAAAAQAWRVVIEGIVQGVGFRPFVHRLAREWGVSGTVLNFTGGVEMELEGPADALEGFVEALVQAPPPMALIESVRSTPIETEGRTGFVIISSRAEAAGAVYVSPDVAICADCSRELADPSDRRYRHPFINCTNCGPRYTIIACLPYDRPNTSMAGFPMCPACRDEYADIEDRRYHAQPVACPRCGPTVGFIPTLEAAQPAVRDDAVARAQELLAGGGILAVKGLGGFHLACDATNDNAVKLLRERKRREQKPLAVMARDAAAVAGFARLDDEACELLTSARAPIVLLPKRLPERLAPSVAPDSSDYGVMLPYTPLHILLLEGLETPALVMTSGNLSDEPLCTANAEARKRLATIADGFLLHDREILVGCDDSVVRSTRRGLILIRRSRGYAPLPVRLQEDFAPTLGVGGHLKNTFCLVRGRDGFLSQHIGDLSDAETLDYYERCLRHLLTVWQAEPQAVACDLHPGYLSTRLAHEWAAERDLPIIAVQHHHAHIVSCLADNGRQGPAIGLACDGTGYGADGTAWGCELLIADLGGYERVGHLATIPLPGAEAAIRQPWRVAATYLRQCFGVGFADELDIAFCRSLDRARWAVLDQMLERGLNCPLASSAGRLFDGVAALVGLHGESAYEGQAAMSLEAAARPTDAAYSHGSHDEHGRLVLNPEPMIREVVADLQSGASLGEIAGRFHNGFARMLCEAALWAHRRTGLREVALSGGTFQNRRLLELLCGMLEDAGLEPLWHRSVPPNDGGLSLGQAIVGASVTQSGRRGCGLG